MAARDKFHLAVRNALTKDGWTITDDPLNIDYGGVSFVVDLGAENILAAEKDQQRIAVEIKSFIESSATYSYHEALGQFINYRQALNAQENPRTLYLAVPNNTYRTLFQLPFIVESVELNHLRIIVYEAAEEEIKKWIN